MIVAVHGDSFEGESWPLQRLARWISLGVAAALWLTGLVLLVVGRHPYLFNAGGLTIVAMVSLLNRDSHSRRRAIATLGVVFLVVLGVGIALAVT
jgi:hypothetical protein